MKFAVPICLIDHQNDNHTINMDYAGSLLSLIKYGLSKTDPNLFHQLYETNTLKNFTTSVYFPNAKFKKDKIQLNQENKLIVYFSTSDTKLALAYYNAFTYLHIISKKSLKNLCDPIMFDDHYIVDVFKLYQVSDQPIKQESQFFKTVSPIVIKNDHKRFISCVDESNLDEYNNALKYAIKKKVKLRSDLQALVDTFKFEPIQTKKTIKREFNLYIEATVGIFKVTADPKLLNYLQANGLGIKTGTFNGMIIAI